jgi:hypothetical protein
MVTCCHNPRQDVAHFRLIIDELQQRMPSSALLANAKDIFGGRIQTGN